MAQSFIRQGVNIVCSNMTISHPRKLGLLPEKESSSTVGITINAAVSEPFLNILDKKLDDHFSCKMPKKVWGGFAAFLAGVAIVAVVVIVVITAPVSGPVVTAIAGIASFSTAVTVTSAAVVGGGAAIAYTVYKLSHECDKCLDGTWESPHKNVLIEGERALLNCSRLFCPNGGTLDIIIDDQIAQDAAGLISCANKKEIFWHWGSKFLVGAISFATGGPFGVTIATGLEFYDIYNTDGISNQDANIMQDVLDGLRDNAIDVVAVGLKDTLISKFNAYIWKYIAWARLFSDAGETSVASASNLSIMNQNAYKHIWSVNGLSTEFMKGLGGAIVSFAIDQYCNSRERELEAEANDQLSLLNSKDQNEENNINVISKTQ